MYKLHKYVSFRKIFPSHITASRISMRAVISLIKEKELYAKVIYNLSRSKDYKILP